ncbi:MAG TPA: WYL domain-containing protein, partial [Arcobacter sp.]|nr:WYL domain-containing protein [Arcobacter sp.]
MKETKLQRVLFILEEFHQREDSTLDAYDTRLLNNCMLSPKQMGRLLDEIADEIDSVIIIKKDRRKSYKLLKPMDLFIETLKNSNDISWIFNMAHDGDPELFNELEKFTKKTKHVFQFHNTPFEDTKTFEEKEIFKTLKRAIKNREYVKITFNGKEKALNNLKCLKLIFMEGNWYLAYVDETEQCKFGRVSFMKKVEYGTKKESFHLSSVSNQMKLLTNIKNSMTLYSVPKKIARLKAIQYAKKYFAKDMKPFFKSQRFEKALDNGDVIFTIEYTQELEILPFI